MDPGFQRRACDVFIIADTSSNRVAHVLNLFSHTQIVGVSSKKCCRRVMQMQAFRERYHET